jgi:bacterioferritin-associated ferredoxin
MSHNVRIDRCYCFGKTFAELKAVAQRTETSSIEELQQHALFGRQCRLCHPYVRRMLATGATVFHEILVDEDVSPGGGRA